MESSYIKKEKIILLLRKRTECELKCNFFISDNSYKTYNRFV